MSGKLMAGQLKAGKSRHDRSLQRWEVGEVTSGQSFVLFLYVLWAASVFISFVLSLGHLFL